MAKHLEIKNLQLPKIHAAGRAEPIHIPSSWQNVHFTYVSISFRWPSFRSLSSLYDFWRVIAILEITRKKGKKKKIMNNNNKNKIISDSKDLFIFFKFVLLSIYFTKWILYLLVISFFFSFFLGNTSHWMGFFWPPCRECCYKSKLIPISMDRAKYCKIKEWFVKHGHFIWLGKG